MTKKFIVGLVQKWCILKRANIYTIYLELLQVYLIRHQKKALIQSVKILKMYIIQSNA